MAAKPSPFDSFHKIKPGNQANKPSEIVKKALKPKELGARA